MAKTLGVSSTDHLCCNLSIKNGVSKEILLEFCKILGLLGVGERIGALRLKIVVVVM